MKLYIKKNNLFYSVVTIILIVTTISCDKRTASISIVPEPSSLIVNRGGFTLSDRYKIVSTNETKSIGNYIEAYYNIFDPTATPETKR